jgi:Ca-activated chloride channel family protein
MNPRPRLLGAALAAMTSVVLVAGPGQQVFHGGTDLVQLNVTVANGAGHFIAGLSRDDFQIFEDGVPQDISVFSAERQPIALSILLDSSTSMDTKIAVAQEAAVGFVKRLSEKDVAEVIEFNSHERLVQPFTQDGRGRLDRAL